jgi:hypothetical protein
MDEEESHREFLLQALRAGALRCRVMNADLETIGIALKANLIGADTAVAWIRESNLMWVVGAIPDAVGKVARTAEPTLTVQIEEMADAG